MKEKEKLTFSVIIPTFNRSHFLVRAIESVCAQSYGDYELIVVDDGSTDETEQCFYNLKKQKNPVQKWVFLKQKNLGVSAARNAGVAVASGDWLAFLDSDDEWLPEKLKMQYKLLISDQTLSIIYGDEIWVRNGVRVNPPLKHKKMGGRIFASSVKECLIGCSSVIILKSFFNKMGGFREDFRVCEDYDLWLKITARTFVGFVSMPLVIKHGGRPDQLSLSTKCMDYFRVKAIDHVLKDPVLTKDEVLSSAIVLLEKCEILLKGYIKHNNMDSYQEISFIKQYWEKNLQNA